MPWALDNDREYESGEIEELVKLAETSPEAIRENAMDEATDFGESPFCEKTFNRILGEQNGRSGNTLS